jgi:hypothetical protein
MRKLLTTAAVWLLCGSSIGCSSRTSDYVSYAIWNRNTEQEVQDCMVRSAADPPVMVMS